MAAGESFLHLFASKTRDLINTDAMRCYLDTVSLNEPLRDLSCDLCAFSIVGKDGGEIISPQNTVDLMVDTILRGVICQRLEQRACFLLDDRHIIVAGRRISHPRIRSVGIQDTSGIVTRIISIEGGVNNRGSRSERHIASVIMQADFGRYFFHRTHSLPSPVIVNENAQEIDYTQRVLDGQKTKKMR